MWRIDENAAERGGDSPAARGARGRARAAAVRSRARRRRPRGARRGRRGRASEGLRQGGELDLSRGDYLIHFVFNQSF